jgi:hypothetical protein
VIRSTVSKRKKYAPLLADIKGGSLKYWHADRRVCCIAADRGFEASEDGGGT